jgi:DNA (cytosine-5)-methyltransferase 1
MNHLDLFSGIGGFALAAMWAGHETVAFCEIGKFQRKILKKNFPKVPIFEDIRKLNAKELPKTIDVITGGYPCQPFSVAGKRRGNEDDRHLWPEMLRIIQGCRPLGVICENVVGHVSMGLDDVLFDLESEGYTCGTFIIPACSKNKPHLRERVWIVANNYGERRKRGWTQAVCGKQGLQGGEDVGRVENMLRGSDLHTPKLCGRSPGLSERLDALGNAIVPEIAYELMKCIEQ